MARYVSKATSKRIVEELTKRRQKTDKLAGRWWGIYGRKHYRAVVSWDTLQLPQKESWAVLFNMENWHGLEDERRGCKPREYVPHSVDNQGETDYALNTEYLEGRGD